MLINGQWTQNWKALQAADEQGRFVRQVSEFRNWITPDGSAGTLSALCRPDLSLGIPYPARPQAKRTGRHYPDHGCESGTDPAEVGI